MESTQHTKTTFRGPIRHRSVRCPWAPFAILALALVPTLAGCGSIKNWEIISDNDVHGYGRKADHNYTNGMGVRVTFEEEQTPEPVEWMLWLPDQLPGIVAEGDEVTTTTALSVGHQMYTPTDLALETIDLDDRPYAGYLYTAFTRSEGYYDKETPSRDYAVGRELTLGMVGPATRAGELQIWFHDLIGSRRPEGWDHQLENEPILQLGLWRKDRGLHLPPGEVPLLRWLGAEMDTVSILGAEVGNARVNLHGSMNLRLGWGLTRNLGPFVDRVGSGDLYMDKDGGSRWGSAWFVGGVQGRAVARNIFLDGNSFESSHHVNRENLVADMYVGLVLRLRLGDVWLNTSYVYTHRTPEFREREQAHVYGSWRLWFDF